MARRIERVLVPGSVVTATARATRKSDTVRVRVTGKSGARRFDSVLADSCEGSRRSRAESGRHGGTSLALAGRVRVGVVTLPVVLLAACIWRGVPTPDFSKPPPARVLVCDDHWRIALQDALVTALPTVEYARDSRCARALAAVSALSRACRDEQTSCDAPDYVDGWRLIDPHSAYDFIFVVTEAMQHSVLVGWRDVCLNPAVCGQLDRSGRPFVPQLHEWRPVFLDDNFGARAEFADAPSSREPVFLFSPRTGTIVGQATVRGVDTSDVRVAMRALVRTAAFTRSPPPRIPGRSDDQPPLRGPTGVRGSPRVPTDTSLLFDGDSDDGESP